MELEDWNSWYKHTGRGELRAILLEIWDPIGVGQESPDEYDGYLGLIADHLRRGATAMEVGALLQQIAGERMGLPDRARDARAADAVHRWYETTVPRRVEAEDA